MENILQRMRERETEIQRQLESLQSLYDEGDPEPVKKSTELRIHDKEQHLSDLMHFRHELEGSKIYAE